MFAPPQTGRLLVSVSDRTRRSPVEWRWVTPAAREPVAVDAVSLRGDGLHPRGLPAKSALLDGDGDSCSRGEVTVLSLPDVVGGDVQGLTEPSVMLAGDRGLFRCE